MKTSSTSAYPPSPLRVLGAFMKQKQRQLVAQQDRGGLFEHRFVDRLIHRTTVGVTEAHSEAVGIQSGLASIRRDFLLDIAPTDDTPGRIDPREQRRLLRKLAALGHTTRHHEQHLEQLK